MTLVGYTLTVQSEYLVIKVDRKILDKVYVTGKTRAQVTRNTLFHLRVLDVPVNKDRLQSELDKLIWNHVPKHKWY